jgi:hypothetical protein
LTGEAGLSQAARKLPPSPYRDEPKPAKQKPSTQVTKVPPVPGFSAGSSRPEPPPPPERRTLLVAGSVTALAVVVLALRFVVLAGGDDDGNGAASGPPLTRIGSAESTVPQPQVEGSGVAGEAIAVVEHGWYVHEDRVGSYGFVIENTSDQRVGPFVVKVTAYDRDGAVISGLVDWEHRVGVMQPRQRFGMASQLDSRDQADNGISRLDFAIVDDAATVPAPPDGAIVVSEIVGRDGPYRSTVSYDAASTYPVPLEGDAYVLVRDRSGRILGGASSYIDLPPYGTASGDFEFDPAIVGGDLGGLEVSIVPSTRFREDEPG